MTRLEECILYRGFEHGETLKTMAALINGEGESLSSRAADFYRCTGEMVEMAGMYGFSGNLWHNYLTFLLVNHENAFSTAS